MKQEINLYQDQLKDIRPPLNFQHMLLIIGLSVLMLGGLAGFSQQQLQAKEQMVSALKTTVEQSRAQLESLQQQHAPKAKNGLLESQVKALQEERLHLSKRLQTLETELNRPNPVFSSVLEGLARTPQQALWLDEIRIAEGGQFLRLQGLTLSAAEVPRFIEALREQTAFQGRQFHSVEIQRPSEQPDQLQFVIRTEETDKDKAKGGAS